MIQARGLLAVRSGEGRLVGLLAALFATVEAGRGIADVAVTTLFVNRVGAEFLPYLFTTLGFLSLALAIGYGAAIGSLRRRPFLVGVLVGCAAILVVLRVAILADSPIVYGAVHVTVYSFNAILLTLLWTVAGTTLDTRQAKRLFPVCTSAAIAGGFAGTLASGPLAALLGTENLLLLVAALLGTAAAVVSRIVGSAAHGIRAAPGSRAAGSLVRQFRVGFDEVRRSALLRLVAASYVLFGVLLFSVQFPFQRQLESSFPRESDFATAAGLILAAITAASFLVSIAIANRVFVRFGVATAALLLPLVYVAGFGLWLVEFGLLTAVAVSFSQQVVQRGISNAAWSALYNIVPVERRPQVLAFIDGVPAQIGISLSGVLLIVAGLLFAHDLVPVFVMGAGAAIACTGFVLMIRRRYGAALVRTLRSGLAEQVLEGGPGLEAIAREPAVLAELRHALDDASPATRGLAADLLGRIGDREAVEPLVGRLEDDDGTVRATAVRALAEIDPALVVPFRERLAADPDPVVRAELAVALAVVGEHSHAERIVAGLLGSADVDGRVAAVRIATRVVGLPSQAAVETALSDASPRIRAAAAEALGRRDDGMDGSTDHANALVGALDDQSPAVRRAAATALGRRGDATSALLDVLRDGSERAQDAALSALVATANPARDEVRAWALDRVERATRLRAQAAGLRDAPAGTSLEFLRSLLERRGHELQERLLAALASLGASEASGLLRRSLGSTDPDVRAQAIEAIDALGDRQLGRAVVRLLDTDDPDARSQPSTVLRVLSADDDPWIRLFAIRASAEHLVEEYRDVVTRAANDPDLHVRTSLADISVQGDMAMTDTGRTIGKIERMLFLRGVPLFSRLAPEDLQRVAASATERVYPAGEALVTEGDIGDELVVIVEGTVRVVRADGEGERLIRTYAAGDHIGELAVLRDRPRAATVIAEDEGVRGLVIGGEALRAILHERPEAAMAMLATLAERISAQ